MSLTETIANAAAVIADSSLDNDRKDKEVFNSLSTMYKLLFTVSKETIQASQATLEQFLLQLMAPASPSRPSKTTRMLIARILALLFDRGDSKTLYSTIQYINANLIPYRDSSAREKVVNDRESSIAALYCVGYLLELYGKKAGSLVDSTLPQVFNLYRSCSDEAIKVEVVHTMARLLRVSYRVGDTVAKHLSKQLKMDAHYGPTPDMKNAMIKLFLSILGGPVLSSFKKYLLPDMELFIKLTMRLFDGQYGSSRLSSAHLLVSLLELYKENMALLSRRLAKLKKGNSGDSIDEMTTKLIQAFAFPAPSRPLLIDNMTPLLTLSAYLLKYHAKDRVFGIFETMQIVIRNMGTVIVEENFIMLAKFFLDLALNPKFDVLEDISSSNGAINDVKSLECEEANIVRKKLSLYLLNEIISHSLLGENGKINAIKQLVSSFLTPLMNELLPSKASDVVKSVTLTKQIGEILSEVLAQISSLLLDVSLGAGYLQTYLDQLLKLASHIKTPDLRVHMSLACALRAVLLCSPQITPTLLQCLITELEQEAANYVSTSAADPFGPEKLLGCSYYVGACLSAVRYRPMFVSYEWFSPLFNLAANMLKLSSRFLDSISEKSVGSMKLWRKAAVLIHSSWVIMGSLMTLGTAFVKPHLAQLLSQFKSFLSKPPKEVYDKYNFCNLEFSTYVIQTREAACSALHLFLTHNAEIITPEVTKKISSYLFSILGLASNVVSPLSKMRFDVWALNNPRSLDRIPDNCVSILRNSIYPSIATHIFLFQYKIIRCFRMIGQISNFTEFSNDQSVQILRLLIDKIIGESIAGLNTVDAPRLNNIFNDENPMNLAASSLCRGLFVYTGDGENSAKTDESNRGSFSHLPTGEVSVNSEPEQIMGNEALPPSLALDAMDSVSIVSSAWMSSGPENDPWAVILTIPSVQCDEWSTPNSHDPKIFKIPHILPASVLAVDQSILIFGILFCSLSPELQEAILDQIIKKVRTLQNIKAVIVSSTNIDTAISRRNVSDSCNCAQLNTILAIHSILNDTRLKSKNNKGANSRSFEQKVVNSIRDMLFLSLKTEYSMIRIVSSLCLGQLTAIQFQMNSKFPTDICSHLIELILNNSKDPYARAGCCYCLASVLKCCGPLAISASFLKNIASVLEALCVDSNIIVHSWALLAVRKFVESVGVSLSFSQKDMRLLISSILTHAMAAKSHSPFWGTCRAALDMAPLVLDPYKACLQISYAVLDAYGPDLLSESGQQIARLIQFCIEAIRFELMDTYSTLLPLTLADGSSPKQELSVSSQLCLGLIPKSYNLNDPNFVILASITSVSPVFSINVDIARCLRQYLTYFVSQNLDLEKETSWALAQLAVSPSLGITYQLYYNVVKFLWHLIVLQQSFGSIEKNDFIKLLMHLYHLADRCLLWEISWDSQLQYLSEDQSLLGSSKGQSNSIRGDIFEITSALASKRSHALSLLDVMRDILARNQVLSPAKEIGLAVASKSDNAEMADNEEGDISDDEKQPGDVEEDDVEDHNAGDGENSAQASPARPGPLTSDDSLVPISGFIDSYISRSVDLSPLPSWRMQAIIYLQILNGFLLNDDFLDQHNALLAARISDLLRLSFNAATISTVEPVRVIGLRLLEQIIHIFGPVRDTDYPELSFLEQYQAQINAAISLVFAGTATDGSNVPFRTSPELQVAALSLCKCYLISGISTDSNGLQKIGRIVSNILSRCALPLKREGDDGDYLCPTSFAVIRVNVIDCWATAIMESLTSKNLQIVKSLNPIIEPSLKDVYTQSLAIVKEVIALRVANMVMMDMTTGSSPSSFSSNLKASYFNGDVLSSSYPEFSRNILYTSYSNVTLKLLDLSSCIAENRPDLVETVFSDVKPLPFFYEHLGLAFENLMQNLSVLPSLFDPECESVKTNTRTLTSIFRPNICGVDLSKWIENDVLKEVFTLWGRLLMKEWQSQKKSTIITGYCLQFLELMIKHHGRTILLHTDQSLSMHLEEVIKLIILCCRFSIYQGKTSNAGICLELLTALAAISSSIEQQKQLSSSFFYLLLFYLHHDSTDECLPKILQATSIMLGVCTKQALVYEKLLLMFYASLSSLLESCCLSLTSVDATGDCFGKIRACCAISMMFIASVGAVIIPDSASCEQICLQLEKMLIVLVGELRRIDIPSIKAISSSFAVPLLQLVKTFLLYSCEKGSEEYYKTLLPTIFQILDTGLVKSSDYCDVVITCFNCLSSIGVTKNQKTSILLLQLPFFVKALKVGGEMKAKVLDVLVQTAASDPLLFREGVSVLEALYPQEKLLFQTSLQDHLTQKQAAKGTSNKTANDMPDSKVSGKPAIALKMDFGSFA